MVRPPARRVVCSASSGLSYVTATSAGNLDGATGRMVVDLMFDLSRRVGTTLLLITHDMNLAARCDRIVRIADGLIEQPSLVLSEPVS